MRKRQFFRTFLVVLTVLFCTPFIQGGCGGGSGGGSSDFGTPPARTLATLNASSVDSTLDFLSTPALVSDVLSTSGEGDLSGVAAASLDTQQETLFGSLQALLDRIAVESGGASVHTLGSDPFPTLRSCAITGTVYTTMDWDGPSGSITSLDCNLIDNLHMTITMTQCLESASGMIMDGTIEVTLPGSYCDTQEFPSQINFSIDLTVHDSSTNTTLTFSSVTMDVTNIQWDTNLVEITGMDVLLNGTISGNDSSSSVSETYDDFSLGFSDTGTALSVTMDGFVQTSCLDGWVEVATPTALVFPYDFSCPLAGEVNLHGDGDASIIINSDTSLDITVNGSTEYFATCDDIPPCS
jgi:hypothetical protein